MLHVTCYINKCVDDVAPLRKIIVPSNQKLWCTAEVRSLLKTRDAVFRTRDKTALREARNNLTAGMKRDKTSYSKRIQEHLKTNDRQRTWKGLKELTDYRSKNCNDAPISDALLPHALNKFFARLPQNTSHSLILNTGTPQGCVLSPLLFTLLTLDCVAHHQNNYIITFADDTTVVGLISHNNKSAYRKEVKVL